MDSDEARARAEAVFKKQHQTRDDARGAYEAQAQATEAKIARLRALRLAKEAAQKAVR